MNKENELKLSEIHACILEILKKIIEICNTINVNYYVAYGSLIGAVRHGGFIPWDDDFDIVMMRSEYEKFKEYCNKHEEELYPFRFFDRHNTKEYPYGIARFCDLRYRMERNDDTPTAGQGVFIDLYPIDGVGNTKKDINKIYFKRHIYMLLYSRAVSNSIFPKARSKWLVFLSAPAYFYSHLKGKEYFLDKMEALKNLYAFEESDNVACVVWEDSKIFYDKKIFDEYIYMDFEGIKVKVPKEYDAWLKTSYGNYMELPPADMQKPNHNYKIYKK